MGPGTGTATGAASMAGSSQLARLSAGAMALLQRTSSTAGAGGSRMHASRSAASLAPSEDVVRMRRWACACAYLFIATRLFVVVCPSCPLPLRLPPERSCIVRCTVSTASAQPPQASHTAGPASNCPACSCSSPLRRRPAPRPRPTARSALCMSRSTGRTAEPLMRATRCECV